MESRSQKKVLCAVEANSMKPEDTALHNSCTSQTQAVESAGYAPTAWGGEIFLHYHIQEVLLHRLQFAD